MAPAHFSYHCNGKSVFTNPDNDTTLTIYDLQVQVDAKKQRFGDANDCVPFTTAPIWSGLFVTTILGKHYLFYLALSQTFSYIEVIGQIRFYILVFDDKADFICSIIYLRIEHSIYQC